MCNTQHRRAADHEPYHKVLHKLCGCRHIIAQPVLKGSQHRRLKELAMHS